MVVANGVENGGGGPGGGRMLDPSPVGDGGEEGGGAGKVEVWEEEVDEAERSDGVHAPAERGEDEELHAADGLGLEEIRSMAAAVVIFGAGGGGKGLEIEEERDVLFFDLGGEGKASNGGEA